ncbi:hypothetical protein N8510_00285 [bacterium]|nr:hypothetical protein [bacterium]
MRSASPGSCPVCGPRFCKKSLAALLEGIGRTPSAVRAPAAGRFPDDGRVPLPPLVGRSRKFCSWFCDGRLPEPTFPESRFGRDVPPPIEPPPGTEGRVPPLGKFGRVVELPGRFAEGLGEDVGRLADGLGRLADELGRLADELGRLADELGRLIEGERLAEAPPPPRLTLPPPPRLTLPPPLRPPPPRANSSVPINIEIINIKTQNHDR